MLGYMCRLGSISCCFFTYFLFNSFQSGFEPTTSLKLFTKTTYFDKSNKSDFSQHAVFDTADQPLPLETTSSLGFQGTAFALFSSCSLAALSQPLNVEARRAESSVVLYLFLYSSPGFPPQSSWI